MKYVMGRKGIEVHYKGIIGEINKTAKDIEKEKELEDHYVSNVILIEESCLISIFLMPLLLVTDGTYLSQNSMMVMIDVLGFIVAIYFTYAFVIFQHHNSTKNFFINHRDEVKNRFDGYISSILSNKIISENRCSNCNRIIIKFNDGFSKCINDKNLKNLKRDAANARSKVDDMDAEWTEFGDTYIPECFGYALFAISFAFACWKVFTYLCIPSVY